LETLLLHQFSLQSIKAIFAGLSKPRDKVYRLEVTSNEEADFAPLFISSTKLVKSEQVRHSFPVFVCHVLPLFQAQFPCADEKRAGFAAGSAPPTDRRS
jgi:hypothetical protein